MPDHATQQRTLELAFHSFTKVSGELESAYRALESRVHDLNHQLACADRELAARLAAQHRLAKRFRGLLDALPAGVVVLDAHGRVQQCNPAAARLLAGSRSDSPAGEGNAASDPADQAGPGISAAPEADARLAGAEWRKVVAGAFAPRPDDGHDITLRGGRRVNISTCSLGAEPGQVVVLTDVTETRKLQARAARLEQLSSVGRTVAGLAHQVRTPLAGALLHAAALPRCPAREKVIERLRALDHLVEGMLGYSERGAFSLERLSLDTLLDTVLRQQPPAAGGITIRRAGGEGDPPLVEGNRNALASIVQNLIDNARQAPGTTAITLECGTTPGADTAYLRCRDDGPGIAPALAERVFDPFHTGRAEGTGLGLAIVRAVAEAHGGSVRVEPQSEPGACIRLELPRASRATQDLETGPGTNRARGEHR